MQEPISLKRDDDDDNGMQGPISLKRDAASFSASVQHCTLRPLAGCTDLTGHRSFAIIIFQRQAKLPTADAFLIPTSSSSSSQSMWKMVLSNQWLRKGVERKKLLFFWILSKLHPPSPLPPTFFGRQKRQFKRHSKWLIIQNSFQKFGQGPSPPPLPHLDKIQKNSYTFSKNLP